MRDSSGYLFLAASEIIVDLQAATELGDQASVSRALSERLRRKQAARLRDIFQTCPGAAPQLDVPITGWIR